MAQLFPNMSQGEEPCKQVSDRFHDGTSGEEYTRH